MQGFYNILKPTGLSSAAIVGKIKKILHQKKVGHMGTLDPAASGVLTIGVGKAARFFNYFLGKNKQYFAIAEFGIQTDTLDSEGDIVCTSDKIISEDEIRLKLVDFTGKIMQVPPIYSAININGKRAYEIARSGEKVELSKREIEIFSIKLVSKIDVNKYAFRVNCSSGTYIRSLLSDFAISMGTVSNIPVIIRERDGTFEIGRSSTLDEISKNPKENLISIDEMFPNLKKIIFFDKHSKKILNGVKIENEYKLSDGEEFFGYVNNELYGLFACKNGQIYCKINLYEGE